MILDFINSPEELYDFMKENIKYGFVSSKDHKTYQRKVLNDDALYDKTIKESYFLQKPEELLESKCGVCYDQVELEKVWLINNGYKVFTYFTPFHNHAFLIYSDDNKYYLFERTLPQDNGIYEADSLINCINNYVELQKGILKENLDVLDIYPYDNPVFHLDFYGFKDFASKRASEKISFNINHIEE